MKPTNVELHIEELVLDGLPHVDRDRFGQAVQQELSRLFSEQGLPPSLHHGRALAQLDGGNIEVAPGAAEGSVAAQVARAVYGGFKK
jgi:hypothetical protein